MAISRLTKESRREEERHQPHEIRVKCILSGRIIIYILLGYYKPIMCRRLCSWNWISSGSTSQMLILWEGLIGFGMMTKLSIRLYIFYMLMGKYPFYLTHRFCVDWVPVFVVYTYFMWCFIWDLDEEEHNERQDFGTVKILSFEQRKTHAKYVCDANMFLSQFVCAMMFVYIRICCVYVVASGDEEHTLRISLGFTS